jgi:exodeoxyribonuclease VII small subunit
MSSDNLDELRFGQAMERLEGILRRIEEEEVDIDELGVRLEEATKLIELCRAKIRKADVEVTQIVQALEETAEPPAEPGPEDPSD